MRMAWVAALLLATPTYGHEGHAGELRRLSRAIEDAPTAELYLQRAATLRRAGRLAEALADLDRAAALGGNRRLLSRERGLVLAAAGRPEALAALNQYHSLGGRSTEALATRARLLEEGGRIEDAVADLRQVWQAVPTPERCLELARVEERLGRVGEARAVLRQGLATLGGAATVRLALVALERRSGNYDDALREARGGMVGLAVKAEWRLLAAEVLVEARRTAEARRELEQARAELKVGLARRPNGIQSELLARIESLLTEVSKDKP